MKPYDNDRIFWDTDASKLDFDKHKRSIIERVFNRGFVQDIRNCRRYYTDSVIIEILKTAKHLDLRALHLASTIYKIPLNEFRCYILRQLNPTLYPY